MTSDTASTLVARASKNKPLTDNKEVRNVMPMFNAAINEFPFAETLPRREKTAVGKAWDIFVEYQAAVKEHGTLVPFQLAAKVLNVSRQRVDQLRVSGQLKVIYCASHPMVTEASLIAWARGERDKGGRPRIELSMKETWKASRQSARELVAHHSKES